VLQISALMSIVVVVTVLLVVEGMNEMKWKCNDFKCVQKLT